MGRNGPWELYNLKTDRTELHDLAATEAGHAAELAAKWDTWATRANVKPYPTPDGATKKGKKGKKNPSSSAN
jgi:arylsulfatase